MPNSSEIYQTLLDNFPFDTPRDEQLAAFEEIAPWIERLFVQEFAQPIFFGVDAPTGIGKSPLALTVAKSVLELYEKHFQQEEEEEDSDPDEEESKETRRPQVWVVTANKLLQNQYQVDFSDDLFDVRGLDNYPCAHEATTCGQSTCGRVRANNKQKGQLAEIKEQGLPIPKELRPPAFCSFNCGYDKAMKQAATEPILSLNVAKALNLLKNPRYRPPVLMIFDEGHEVESALDNEATFTLTPDELQKIGLSFYKYFADLEDLEDIKLGMKLLVDDCTPLLEAETNASPDTREVRRLKKLESIISKVGETVSNIEQGIEYVSCAHDKLEMKPLQVGKVFQKFFQFPTLFLSATLLSKTGFESLTGIDKKSLDWFACQSPFPVANRPIKMYWRVGAAPLNYGNMEEEMSNLVKRVQNVLDTHPNERGMIHSHTYKIANKIYDELYPQYGSRLIFPESAKDQKDALERHARSKNTVLISPSMTQGVDLRDDLCRFSVMCKVPWLPTNDPVVKARMDANRSWYTFKACMAAVQAPGRGVRSPTDFATTYLVDPGFARFFNMAKEHLPQWFVDSLIMKPCGFY